jgi:hypothetical protein
MYQAVNDQSFEQASRQAEMKKFIFIGNNNFHDSENLIWLINKRKWAKFDAMLMSLSDSADYNFLKSIKLLLNEQYQYSYQTLNKLPDNAFDCQVKILKTDCLKELGVNSIDYHKEYQGALDCSPNDRIKFIAKTRYRFFKYGY